MLELLEVLVAFVGVMLVLALASQSALEVVKTMLPIKGMTRVGSARSLVQESAVANGLTRAQGTALYDAISERLRGLGQSGWFGVRLDSITPEQLEDLVESIDFTGVPGLDAVENLEETRSAVASRAKEWFDLAMNPVASRYRRRMRVANVLTAAAIVFFLKVDAIALMERIRTDANVRGALAAQAAMLDSLGTRADSLGIGLADLPGDTTPGADADSLRARLDRVVADTEAMVAGAEGIFVRRGLLDFEGLSFQGLLFTTLLVSLGAPFWHDLLGSVFGLKRKIMGTPLGRAPGDDPPRPSPEG